MGLHTIYQALNFKCGFAIEEMIFFKDFFICFFSTLILDHFLIIKIEQIRSIGYHWVLSLIFSLISELLVLFFEFIIFIFSKSLFYILIIILFFFFFRHHRVNLYLFFYYFHLTSEIEIILVYFEPYFYWVTWSYKE